MYPKTKIRVFPDGRSHIDGQEHSDQCFKLSDLGRSAGKVVEEKNKEHQPVDQDVNRKGA